MTEPIWDRGEIAVMLGLIFVAAICLTLVCIWLEGK